MNIAFSKIGKSIKFGGAYSPIGGDNESPSLIRLLANNNPDKKFYLVGRSDFCRLSEQSKASIFPYNNVIDCYDTRVQDIHTHLSKKLAGVKIDVHIAMTGQIGTVTIPGKIRQVRNPELFASVIDMTSGYSSPITCWMNDNQDIPILNVINDPRYDFAQSRDIIVNPKWSLSQYEYSYEKNSILSYENQERKIHKIDVTYAEMEKIFLYDRKKPSISTECRSIQFLIVLNEGSPSRYSMLEEWVLDKVTDVEIYGKWDKEEALTDPRFKGSLHIDELQKKLKSVRSSFIIPIAPGWVTSKYIELIHAGVVPFFHPSYDTQNNLKVPDFLRPKNSEELLKRVKMMEDDSIYEKTITALTNKYLSDDLYDGTRLNDIIMKTIEPSYNRTDLTKYKKQEVLSLDEFF